MGICLLCLGAMLMVGPAVGQELDPSLEAAVRRFEAEVGSLDPSGFDLPLPAPEENAAEWILAASRAIDLSEEESTALFHLTRRTLDTWTPAEIERVRAVVGRNAEARELLRRALSASGSSYSIDYRNVDQPEVVWLIPVLRVARLAGLTGQLAVAERDLDGIAESAALLRRFADSVAGEPYLLSTSLALVLHDALSGLVRDTIASGIGDAGLLAELASQLAGPDLQGPIERGFHYEAVVILNAEPDPAPADWEPWMDDLEEQKARAEMLDDFRVLIGALGQPWPQIEARFATPDRSTAHQILWPNLLAFVEKLKGAETARSLARRALELWRLRVTGEPYPDSLTVPPRDSYSAEPILYERRADGTVRLGAPAALARWERSHGQPARTPPFEWVLPAAPIAASGGHRGQS